MSFNQNPKDTNSAVWNAINAKSAVSASSSGSSSTVANYITIDNTEWKLPAGGSTIDVDDEMSSTSTNPVQNKVIYTALQGKASTSDVSSAVSTHNSDTTAHSDIRTTLSSKADSSTVTTLATRVTTAEGDIDTLESTVAGKSTVTVSATGTATDEVAYITVDGTEKKIKCVNVAETLTSTTQDPVKGTAIYRYLQENVTYYSEFLSYTNTHNASSTVHQPIQNMIAAKSTVTASATGTSTSEVSYITIDGTEYKLAGSSITIDSAMSSTSTNPVQNKVIYTELQGKATSSDISTAVSNHDSSNSAHSDIRTLINAKPSTSDITSAVSTHNSDTTAHSDIRTTLSGKADSSTVTTLAGRVTTAESDIDTLETTVAGKSTVTVSDTGTATDEVEYITVDGTEKKIKDTVTTVDSTITSGGTNPVQGGAIYTALADKADSSALANYLPLSGGTLTGKLTIAMSGAGEALRVNRVSTFIGNVTILSVATLGANSVLSASPAAGDDSKKIASTEWAQDEFGGKSTVTASASGTSTTGIHYITIDGTEYHIEGSAITIDSAMSSTSTNPVQNNVIYTALQDKADSRTVTILSGRVTTVEGNIDILESIISSKSTVSASATGTSTTEVSYITIDGTEYKLAGSGLSGDVGDANTPVYLSNGTITSTGKSFANYLQTSHNSDTTAHSDIRTTLSTKSTVTASSTGSSTTGVHYITIDGTEYHIEGSAISIDSAMSSTSTNPVQNKVIYTALQDKADSSTVTTLAGRVTTAESDIDTLESTVAGHTTSISTINTTLGTKADSSTVTALTTRVSTAEDDIDDLETTVASHTTQIAGKASTSDVTTAVSNHNSATDAHSDIRTLINNKPSSSDITSAVSTHNSDTTAHSDIRTLISGKSTVSASSSGTSTSEVAYITIDGTQYKIKDTVTTVDSSLSASSTNPVQNKVINTALGNKADSSTVTALTTRVTTAEGDIDDLESTVAGHTTSISTINTTLGTKADSSTVTTLAGRVTTAEGDIDDLETTVAEHTTSIASKAAQSDLTALTTRVTTAEGDIDTLESTVASHTTQIAGKSTVSASTTGTSTTEAGYITIDSTEWKLAEGSVPVGTIIWVAMASAPEGYLACNGANKSRTTYADLFAAIGTLYGAGDGSTTFTLPKLTNSRFPQGGTPSTTSTDNYVAAGLPNITSASTSYTGICGWSGGGTKTVGALKFTALTAYPGACSAMGYFGYLDFNASRSSSKYGNSTTVQPAACILLPCIKY